MGIAVALVAAYIIGSMPIGLLVVRLATGQDVRRHHSGRTGGTNVARVAGFWAGFVTGVLDILKGACAVWLGEALAGGAAWVAAAAGVLTVLGHNHSVFLPERVDGKLRLRGGAGGAPTMGAAMGLWAPSLLIVLPLFLIALLGIGYASLATMTAGLIVVVTFAVRAALGQSPWEYVVFGLVAEALLLWALRPNIRRLLHGQERLVGLRAALKAKREASDTTTQPQRH
jgi:glycerol-3-phosphate acyltransferase PlsY